MAKIFVSVPILGRPELKMIYSLYQSIFTCKEHQVRLYFNENDSLISRVRNAHISTFINEYKDCDYFMSIDSDLEIINCYGTNNIFSKLVAHDKDFVGGLYALKKPGTPVSSSIPDSGNMEKPQFDSGLMKMKWLSSGCWCIKRSVIEKMVAAYPELTYDGDDNMAYKKVHGLYIPFIADLTNENGTFKKYLSEDWAFAHRWKAIGGEIYADTSIVLKHIGTFPYSLWNVEVVAAKKDEAKPSIDVKQPNGSVFSLPPAGFDLTKTK